MNNIEWIVGGDRKTLLKLLATLYAYRTALIQGTKVKVRGNNVSIIVRSILLTNEIFMQLSLQWYLMCLRFLFL